MPIYNILVTTEKRKIVNYNAKRTVLVIRNRSATNNVEISETPLPDAPYFTVLPNQAYTFIKALGDDTTLELWAKTTSGEAVVEIVEFYEK